MSLLFGLILNFSCPKVKMLNQSQEPWNKRDYKTLRRVKIRCSQIYRDTPCVKLFWKTEPLSYRVICGGKK